MDIQIDQGAVIRGFSSQHDALDASFRSPAIGKFRYDELAVSPCALHVSEEGKDYYFPALQVDQLNERSERISSSLLVLIQEGEGTSSRIIWIPPQLVDGENFSLRHFSGG